MNSETIELRINGAIAVLTLNKPESLNSLDKALLSNFLSRPRFSENCATRLRSLLV